jgi:hypothetical protein
VAAYSDSYSLRTPVHQFQINSLVHHTKFQRSLAFIHACLWPTRTATSLRAAKHRPNTAYLQSVWSIDSRIVSPSNRISAIPPRLSTLIDLEPAYLTARLVAAPGEQRINMLLPNIPAQRAAGIVPGHNSPARPAGPNRAPEKNQSCILASPTNGGVRNMHSSRLFSFVRYFIVESYHASCFVRSSSSSHVPYTEHRAHHIRTYHTSLNDMLPMCHSSLLWFRPT